MLIKLCETKRHKGRLSSPRITAAQLLAFRTHLWRTKLKTCLAKLASQMKANVITTVIWPENGTTGGSQCAYMYFKLCESQVMIPLT